MKQPNEEQEGSASDRPSRVRKPKVAGGGRRREVPISILHRLFTYDPETGVLRHKAERRGVKAGSIATTHNPCGYLMANVGGGVQLRAHRIAWAIHHGSWPPDQIDHINGVRGDNRICNLRLATVRENCSNRAQPLSPTAGVRGVSWAKSRGKWYAQIKRNYRSYSLGHYDTIEEASAAYQKAAMEMHGEFSILHREGVTRG